MLNVIDNYNGGLAVATVPSSWLIAAAVISVLVYGVLYALRGVGLYTMAKKSGKAELEKIAFLAWIPVAWTYLAGNLAGTINLFGKPIYKYGLILVIVFSVAQAMSITSFVLTYFPLIGYFLSGGKIAIFIGSATEGLTASSFAEIGYEQYLLDGTFFVGTAQTINYQYANVALVSSIAFWLDLAYGLLSLVNIVAMVFMYVNLFKRYYPTHFVLATILSIWLGIFPIYAFAIRNRKPINYSDFLRERRNRTYYNPYGQGPYGQGGQGGPYGNQNGYGQGGYGNPNDPRYNQNQQPPNPFDEFADGNQADPGDPFADFFDDDRRDDDK